MEWIQFVGDAILKVALPGLSTILVGVIIWAINRYIKDEQLARILVTLVRWAEQTFGPGAGDAKRAAVDYRLTRLGYDPTDPLIDAAVEAAVNFEFPKFDLSLDAEGE